MEPFLPSPSTSMKFVRQSDSSGGSSRQKGKLENDFQIRLINAGHPLTNGVVPLVFIPHYGHSWNTVSCKLPYSKSLGKCEYELKVKSTTVSAY